ncbi:MAG TPA: SDR family oxidoreductase [Acidimicrobiales bacterium]|nr:SDR family oxidoreductase [Acidimicrobiales bacterium]
MATIVITGSAGGIGTATRQRLEAAGHTVIGVDVRDAEVIADLSIEAGRQAMAEAVSQRCDGVLDGVVAGAGVSGAPGELVVAINYFGAVATLDLLRPLLARGTRPAAVAISSNSTTTQAGYPADVVQACLDGDEALALELAAADPSGVAIYPAAKLALARWVRRQAVAEDWIGAGIHLNAIAPGFVQTPMTAGSEDFILGLGDIYPIPLGRAGQADEVAGLLTYLLGPDAGFFVGSFVTMDGGTDAALRPDHWPAPPPA